MLLISFCAHAIEISKINVMLICQRPPPFSVTMTLSVKILVCRCPLTPLLVWPTSNTWLSWPTCSQWCTGRFQREHNSDIHSLRVRQTKSHSHSIQKPLSCQISLSPNNQLSIFAFKFNRYNFKKSSQRSRAQFYSLFVNLHYPFHSATYYVGMAIELMCCFLHCLFNAQLHIHNS